MYILADSLLHDMLIRLYLRFVQTKMETTGEKESMSKKDKNATYLVGNNSKLPCVVLTHHRHR